MNKTPAPTRKLNPKIPEGINSSTEHPLKEFMQLVIGVGILLVVLMFTLGLLAKLFAHHIPFTWEPKLQLTDTEQTAYPQAQQTLEELLTRLEQAQPVLKDATIEYKIHLMDSDVPNAFATLGGQIYINRGLLDHVESENGLAMVIAHEMAHVQLRHPIKAFSQNAVFQLVTGLVFGDSAITGIASHTGMLTFLSFSRDMEREADQIGLQTLAAAYGHTQGATEFFESMSSRKQDSIEFFQTHPDTEERIKVLTATQQIQQTHKGLAPLPESLRVLRESSTDGKDSKF